MYKHIRTICQKCGNIYNYTNTVLILISILFNTLILYSFILILILTGYKQQFLKTI